MWAKVFGNPNVAVLSINGRIGLSIVGYSQPGGSLVEGYNIYKDLRRWADAHGVKLVTFGQDRACGAGYLVLSAGDEVYLEPSCLVGNVGASMNKVDFTKLYQKWDIEQTTVKSNENMIGGSLPFLNLIDEKDRPKLEKVIKHHADKFIEHIIKTRGEKLNKSDVKLMEKWQSGELFLAEEAIKMGLADSTGNMFDYVAKNHPENHIKICEPMFTVLSPLRTRVYNLQMKMDAINAKIEKDLLN